MAGNKSKGAPKLYGSFVNSGPGAFIASKVGLPQPEKLRRYAVGEPTLPGPVLVGGKGRVADAVRTLLSDYTFAEFSEGSGIKYGALVFDATGIRLFYNLRLPWWERFTFSEADIAHYDAEHDPEQLVDTEFDAAAVYDELVQGEIQWLATLLLGAEFFDTWRPWDTDTVSYDLIRAPTLRFPELWTENGD